MIFSPPDNLIQQSTRYAVMAILARADDGAVPFTTIARAAGVENLGNLSTHAQILADAGYLKFRKSFVARRPHTVLVLTPKGRAAFAEHQAKLDAMSTPAPEAA